jgi:hypothetical protein
MHKEFQMQLTSEQQQALDRARARAHRQMAEMKAIGPRAIAAFNDALQGKAMTIKRLRYIPERT